MKKVLGQQGLRSSHSADTRRHSNSPPYYPSSDGNLSTSSSTGSLKRRRSVRNKNEITFNVKQDQWMKNEEGVDSTQKKLKGLNLTLYQNKSRYIYKITFFLYFLLLYTLYLSFVF